MRIFLLISIFLSSLVTSCSSVADSATETKEVVESDKGEKNAAKADDVKTPVVGDKKSIVNCDMPPAPVLCCQAMTPVCNSCRENAVALQNEWRSTCLGSAKVDCSEKPSISQCCSTNEPSCEACRKRMARLVRDFQSRCGVK